MPQNQITLKGQATRNLRTVDAIVNAHIFLLCRAFPRSLAKWKKQKKKIVKLTSDLARYPEPSKPTKRCSKAATKRKGHSG